MRIQNQFLLAAFLLPVGVFLSGDLATARAAAQPVLTNESAAEFIGRLRNEGTNRSQMAEIFGYLTDVIGPGSVKGAVSSIGSFLLRRRG